VQIARALVLATPDADDRPWSSAGACPKTLMPVASRPVVYHTLDALSGASMREAMLVTLPTCAPAFEAAIGDGGRWGMSIRYTAGSRGLDLCGVLDVARGFVGDEPILVHHADALFNDRLGDELAGFTREGLDALALRIGEPAPADARARQTGCYLLSAGAVSELRTCGEERDPLDALRRRGAHVRVLDLPGCLACAGDEASLLCGNRHALERLASDVAGELHETEIQGPVVVHPTARLHRSLVRGPAIIGASTTVSDSYIGPYTSIGDGVRIEGTEIEHSIVMDGAHLMHVGVRLETSVIGRRASITRHFRMPNAVRLTIGDGAAVALS
jgi:glucose-1-phosphate thymidylyltransferase